MFKLLLCWRYLRTRYIALACVVSVMLGVATMIVVNCVMAGFTHEMQTRIHGILSDVVVDIISLNGVPDYQWHREEIERLVGEHIESMSPTVHVPAMLSFDVNGKYVTRPVNLIGIDAETYASVGDFGKYLQHPENRRRFSFALREGGYDTHDHQVTGSNIRLRPQMEDGGWPHRRAWGEHEAALKASVPREATGKDPFQRRDDNDPQRKDFDARWDTYPGAVVGIGLSARRMEDGTEYLFVVPGDDIQITYPTAGAPPDAANMSLTVVDLYESKMSEYDSSFVFLPLEALQEARGMAVGTQRGSFTSIQIKLKPGADLDHVRDLLREHFSEWHRDDLPPDLYVVETWRDRQGPLLAAVQMEMAVLNVLLFLIIAVAGFGILAIFFMIVVEKTRDIGILKSLGASGGGVMQIFLGYGLSLGIVGSGVGMIAGLLFVYYINEIADLLGWLIGRQIFDPSIYYFHKIPTIVDPFTVAWIAVGAMAIAVLASVLPARRAARLHPVEALRYE